MTGLTGEKDELVKPECNFLTDNNLEIARKKIMSSKQVAVTLEEQKKWWKTRGMCSIRTILYHLIKDDKELNEIYNDDCKR